MNRKVVEIQNREKAGCGGNRTQLNLLQKKPLAGGTFTGGMMSMKDGFQRAGPPVVRQALEGLQITEDTEMAKPIHVVPYENKWAWRREGSERVSGVTDTQTQAVEQARPAAQRDGVELYIHRPNGQIRDRDSHGRDPFPPRG